MELRPPQTLADVPRAWARFCLGLGRFSQDELGVDFPSGKCLVACSGGADSTALLLAAALLCRLRGGSVLAAHLDHCLRPEASADAAFVQALCTALNIPCVFGTADVATLASGWGVGLEEAARRARYAFLEEQREKFGAAQILVGHQLNDLAEDLLLRLQRGAGWPGLGGMVGHDADRRLLRPLLLTPRSKIEAFLKALRIPWQTDLSNADPCLSARNRVRQGLLPLMLKENPKFLDAAARLWRQARADEAHWAAEAGLADISPDADGTILLPARALASTSRAGRLRLFKAALDMLGPGQALCDGVFDLERLWQAGANGRTCMFPGDKTARITKQGIRFRVIDRKIECG